MVMKCPFCGAELVQAKSTVNKIWHCSNIDCKAHDYFGVDDFWNTLIDGKKAQDALKESARIMRGLFGAVRKSRIGTTYAKTDEQSGKMTFGDYKTEAAQWLFDNYGVFWKDATNFLTDEQKAKIVSITKQENE